MSPTQTGPLADVHAYLKSKDKDFTADLPTFEQDMQDDGVRQQVYEYLKGQDKEFTASFDEFSTDLGVKKKSGGSDLATGGAPTGTANEPVAPIDVPEAQVAPGTQSGDTSFGLPDAGPLGYQLPGAPLPAAEQAITPELQTQVPYAPGTQVNPAYLGAPGTYTDEQFTGDTPQLIPQRAPLPEEQTTLDTFPALKVGDTDHGGEYPKSLLPYITKTDMDENDVVQLPPNYGGGTPAGTFTDKATGLRYFTRPLSNKVDGKEQTRAQAFGTSFLNASKEIIQGAAEGTQAVANLASMGLPTGAPTSPLTFGDELSEGIEAGKGKLAPIYTAPGRQNVNTITAQAGSFAPMVLAQVAQTLAPETRLPTLLKGAVGLAGTVAFDAPLIHGARERAKEAGLTGTNADMYTIFESAMTLGAFKLGGKLLGQAGDAAVLKAAPKEFGEAVALDATARVSQLEQQLGRAATQSEQAAALGASVKAALPKLVQFAKGTVQQAVTLPLAGAVTTAANQVGATALGGKPEEITARSFWEARKRDAIAGLVMGGVTEGVGAGLEAAGALIRRPLAPGEVAPAETELAPEEAPVEPAPEPVAAAPEPVAEPAPLPDGAPTPFPADRTAAMERLARMQQRLAGTKAGETPEATLPVDEPAQVAPDTPSPTITEPSPVEPPTGAASPSDAVGGPVSAADAEPLTDINAPQSAEPIAPAEPHPDHLKPLTKQQQATNNALDALDRYNALKPGQKKGKEGSAARAEIAKAAKKANIEVSIGKDGKVILAGGKRLTRTNEYTATTPAANHVPLDARPEDAHAFMEAMLFNGDQANVPELQGLGIKVRGKELSARELADAVKDIRAGKNTLRAQLVLDTLENAHRQGFVEKSTGTGLATQKFRVPVEDYLGGPEQKGGNDPVDLSDAELDSIYESDPKAKEAVDNYAFSDGTIDYERLASDERGLPFMFDVTDETATKLANLARERTSASQPEPSNPGSDPTTEPAQAGTDTGSAPQSDARVDEPTPASGEVAPEGSPVEQQAAANKASIERLKSLSGDLWTALGKQTGKAGSIGGGLHPDVARILKEMIKESFKLGVGTSKQAIARIRASDSRLTADVITDEQIKAVAIEALKEEGKFRPKAKRENPDLPPNEPEGTATRRTTERILTGDMQAEELKQRIRDEGLNNYEPVSLAETEAEVDKYLRTSSSAAAYEMATRTDGKMALSVRTALRVRLLKMEGQRLTDALTSNDTEAADTALERAVKITEALAKEGTEAGRGINAYKLLVTHSPEAAVYQAQKEVSAQRVEAEKKLGSKATKEGKAVRKAKAEALDNTLASPAVRAAREKVAGKQPVTSRERRAEIKAERDDLFTQLRALAKKGSGVAYGSLVPLTPQQVQAAAIHVKIFRTYIQEGLTHITSLVERFKREAGPAAQGLSDQELRRQAAAAKGDHDEAIRQGTAALGTTLDKIARDHLSAPAAIGKTLAEQFAASTGLSAAEAKTYADAIEAEFAKRIAAAKQRRIDELNKRASATPTKRPAQSDLQKTQELFTLSPTDDNAILDHLKRVNDLPELTAQDVADLRKLAQDVQNAPEGFQKDAAVEKLLKKQATIKGVNWADIGSAVWYANVLSGYKTHVVNLTANVVQTSSELGISTIHAIGTGRGRFATASIKGLAKGLARGSREAYSVLTTGRETSREPGKYEVPSLLENVRFAGGAGNPYNYLKIVGRSLRAGDVLFASGLKEMRAHELAVKLALEDAKSTGIPTAQVWAEANEKLYNTTQRLADARTQAQSEGLTGNDLERRVYEIAEQSRGANIMDEAREYGTRAVFNGEVKGALGWVAAGIQHITTGIDIKGFKPAKFVVPFTRVITNVANAYLDYTPVGAVRAAKGSHIFGGNAESSMQREFTREERQKLAVKAVVGASVSVAAYALSHMKDDEGNALLEISGAGTGNYLKDAQLKTDGWQPYSIRLPGTKTWVTYAYTPVGIMLAAVGNLNDGEKYRGELLSDDEGALNAIYMNSFRAMQFAKDMTALKGAADFLGAVDSRNPTQISGWVQRMGSGSIKGYAPWSALITQSLKDGEAMAGLPKKQGRTFAQMFYQDIPVARNSVNDALDALGDPLPIDTDRLFSAPPHRDEATQRIWNWMNKNSLFISVPNRNSGGAMVLKTHEGKEGPMTDNEYYAFMKKRGSLLKGFIQLSINDLETMDNPTAKRVLSQLSKAAGTQAKAEIFGPDAIPIGERVVTANEDE